MCISAEVFLWTSCKGRDVSELKIQKFWKILGQESFFCKGKEKRYMEDENHCSSQTHPLLAGHICYSFMLLGENICPFCFVNKFWDCEIEVLFVAVTSQLQTQIVINSLEKPFLKSLLPIFSFPVPSPKQSHTHFVCLARIQVSFWVFYAIYMNSIPVSFI